MKRPQLFKRILAGSLVLTLTVLEGVPAMAADMQPSESAVEAEVQAEGEETEVLAEEELQEAEAPAVVEAEPLAEGENEGEPAPGEGEGETVEPPVITGTPVVNVSETWDGVYLTLSSYNVPSGAYVDIVVKDSKGSEVRSYYEYESGDSIYIDSDELTQGMRYTVTLKPYVWNDNWERVEGTQVDAFWTAPTVEAVSGLAVKEMDADGFVFTHSAIAEGSTFYYEYSKSSTFDEKVAEVEDGSTSSKSKFSIGYYNLDPGVTYYVRGYASRMGIKGRYSNVISVKAPVAEVTGISTEIADTSITLKMHTGYGDKTGFQIARKSGKKYKTLTTTTDGTYKDTGLKKNTKYTYRVRAYYYNTDTKKTVYGAYEYITVQTGKAAMNLRAQAAGKNSIKLTWKKVPGASGYDIYRYTGSSESSTVKEGESYGFSKYELIKSLSRKKKSYTDKKLVSGESYSYVVKAYKTVKGKKRYFTQGSDDATTKFSFSTSVEIYKRAQNPKTGKMVIAWKRVPKAKGYLIEKYDEKTEEWAAYKKLGSSKKTSYTLPAAPLGESVEYRVRAYSGNKYSYGAEATVTGHLAVVTGVKAKSTQNGIVVSWKPVPNATYYRVYRTTNSGATYDADTKSYDYFGGTSVSIEMFKPAQAADTSYYTLGSSTAKMQNDWEAAAKLGYKGDTDRIVGTSVTDYAATYHWATSRTSVYGPRSDVKYYYYVVAYNVRTDAATKEEITSRSYGESKAAAGSMAGNAAVKAPSIKVKAGSKSATVSYKKVKNAKSYLIYRADSKKGAFRLVATTKKTKFKDKKLTSKKTYRYKVRALSRNSLGADNYSGFSKTKSVKAK